MAPAAGAGKGITAAPLVRLNTRMAADATASNLGLSMRADRGLPLNNALKKRSREGASSEPEADEIELGARAPARLWLCDLDPLELRRKHRPHFGEPLAVEDFEHGVASLAEEPAGESRRGQRELDLPVVVQVP